MAKTLPISEAQIKLGELVAGLAAGEEEIVITRNGRPAAVLVTPEAYEALKETLTILANPQTLAQIKNAQDHFDTGQRGLSLDEVLAE